MKNPKQYSEEEKRTIANKLKTYKQQHGLSDNKLGKMIGLGQYVGYILKGRFEVPSGKTVTPIANAYFSMIDAFLGEDVLVINTRNYSDTTTTLMEAKMYQEVRVIHGKKGAGKTFSIKQFVRDNPEDTYVVTCAGDMRQRELIVTIGNSVGIDTSGSPVEIRRAIRDKLENREFPIIIIDEAENLLPKHYASIKALYDDLEDLAGIVLVGSHKQGKTYWDWLLSMAARSKGCFPQVVSRFSMYPVGLGDMIKADCIKMAQHYHIEDKGVQENLFIDCKGDYRVLNKLIKRIVRKRQVLS